MRRSRISTLRETSSLRATAAMTLSTKTLRHPGISHCIHRTISPFLHHTNTIARAYSDDIHLSSKAGQGRDEARRLDEIKRRWSQSSDRPERTPSSRKTMPDGRRSRTPLQRTQVTPRKSKKSPSIPFEGPTGSATPSERLQNTTMTPREMQVFEELFRKGVERRNAEGKGDAKDRPSVKNASERDFPELLKPLAEEAALLQQKAQAERTGEIATRTTDKPLQELEIKDEQALAIKKLMDGSSTDVECWAVLQEQVFQRLRETPDHVAMQSKFSALPALLQHYMELQTNKLATTHSLGLLAIPELKRLGPLAFALGATIGLYNQHMRLLWRQYSDLDEIDLILTEMETEVYPFNEATQDLVTMIVDHAHAAVTGKLGSNVRALWSMDHRMRGLAKIKEWKKVIDGNLESQALERVQASQAMNFDEPLKI